MKFSQGDIIEVPQDENNGYNYNHVKITFPCENYNTDECWLVDAIPCDIMGNTHPKMEVGEPTLTDTFICNVTEATDVIWD